MAIGSLSLRSLVSAIGLSIALITAVSVPVGYFAVGYLNTAHLLDFKADLNARYVAKYIYAHNTLWQFQRVRLAEVLGQADGNSDTIRKRIVDSAGKLAFEDDGQIGAPSLVRGSPLVVNGETIGRVELETSLQGLLAETGVVAVLSILLGLGMFFAVRVFPLRVLDQTLGALEKANHRFDAALNNMSQGLLMMDQAEAIVVCNDRYIAMYDLSRDIVKPGCTLSELLRHRAERGHLTRDPDQYREVLMAEVNSGKATNRVLETGDGREISITDQPMPNGGWVSTHEDITERRAAQAKISHMALHDALTNLPNRLYFHEQLENRFAHQERDQKFAVLCFDLDRFKSVNDTLGHQFGDKLLRQVAERMRGCLRDGDTLARLGGDEFAILQGSVKEPTETNALAARLNEVISAPFDLDGHQAVIGVSIGIAVAPADATGPDQLLKNADMALYRAKADGRGTYRFFEREMDALMQKRRALEADLRKALVNGEFELYYQPIVNLEKNDICGFEALLRWNHPERGLIPPLDFIPLAEETELIVPVGEWVLRQACQEAIKWPSDISIAVNVSSAQFKVRTLAQVVMGALARSGLAAQRLELEITESVLLLNTEATLATLHQLRELGVRISMDDFGTGYSSLSYLRSFPFDKIKIDRSFVHDLASDEDSMAIIRAVTGLGTSLGMATTGEGVETQEELNYLKSEGCTEAQGYFFSRPKPSSEIHTMLNMRPVIAKAVA
jgi:diguanylate cyclase (GGDEF)-like protein